jgi:hypothetical protein
LRAFANSQGMELQRRRSFRAGFINESATRAEAAWTAPLMSQIIRDVL